MNHNPCIYIIDQNSTYRKIVADMLMALGYKNVHIFENAEDCCKNSPSTADIVILDYTLGKNGKNGLDFMRRYIRKHHQASFIFFSSITRVENAVECVKSGAVDYIIKSKLGLERLTSKIDKVYRNKISLQRSLIFQRAVIAAIGLSTSLIALGSWMYNH